MNEGKIVKISGPLVVAKGLPQAKMYEVVRVGSKQLIGEIVELKGDLASIQVYEETEGLSPGESVISTGQPLCVELGPGLIGSIYDGIQRPLDLIYEKTGSYIGRGLIVDSINRETKWHFMPILKKGDEVKGGDIIGVVQETTLIEHKIMVPPQVKGIIEKIKEGSFTVVEPIAEVQDGDTIYEIQMFIKWPIRESRPFVRKLSPREPLVTGQRVIDTFFPLAKGGTACIPGPFGSGKTVVQHQLAKWSDVDVVLFIGCGERGNEMTDVLTEFPKLHDPETGEPLMKRTILVANTSNMPVAAREASIYTGITIAEYFRDMGYTVLLLADSTSRWAEALREMSGRLEEMPGEEGYPAYLGSRLAEFYERTGRFICLGSDQREGSLTAVGAVSPPGGDLSEPVSQNTLRIVRVFWGLDGDLAYRRHFPAINWLKSYSLYLENLKEYYKNDIAEDWLKLRELALSLLQQEADLEEIVRLVGMGALSLKEQIILLVAKSLREDYLHQIAFDPADAYTTLTKQYYILKVILSFYSQMMEVANKEISIDRLSNLPVWGKIAKAKYVSETERDRIPLLEKEISLEISSLFKNHQ